MSLTITSRPHRHFFPEWMVFETEDQHIHVVADPEDRTLDVDSLEWGTVEEARALIDAITQAIAWLESETAR